MESSASALVPGDSGLNFADLEPHALVVGRIEPQHAVESVRRLVEPFEAPQAEPEAMHAAQEGPVADPTPRQHTVEARLQRKLTDAQPRLVMPDGILSQDQLHRTIRIPGMVAGDARAC